MEATVGYTNNEVSPIDRLAEAQRRSDEIKRSPLRPDSIAANRERLRVAVEQAVHDRRNRNESVYCPECLEIYSRGYISRHRREKHGVVGKPSCHVAYAQAFRTREKPKRPICPECGGIFMRKDIAPHRRAVHGAETPQGLQVGYRYTDEY